MEPIVPQPQSPVAVPTAAGHPPRIGLWIFGIIAIVSIAAIAWLLFTRMVLAPTVEVPSGGATITAIASVAGVAVGEQFTVDIIVDAGQLSLSAADLVITYDATLLKGVGIKAGTFLPAELAGGAIGNGKATITVASGTAPVTGTGTVVTLTFQAIASGTAAISPAVGSQIAATGQTKNVVGTTTPVSVTIR